MRRPDFIVVLRVPGSQQQDTVSKTILAKKLGRGPAGVGPAEIVSPVRTDVTETARKRFSPTLGAYSSMTICGFEPLYGGGDDDRSCSGAGTESTLRCFGRLHSSRQSTVSEDRLMFEIGSHT